MVVTKNNNTPTSLTEQKGKGIYLLLWIHSLLRRGYPWRGVGTCLGLSLTPAEVYPEMLEWPSTRS